MSLRYAARITVPAGDFSVVVTHGLGSSARVCRALPSWPTRVAVIDRPTANSVTLGFQDDSGGTVDVKIRT